MGGFGTYKQRYYAQKMTELQLLASQGYTEVKLVSTSKTINNYVGSKSGKRFTLRVKNGEVSPVELGDVEDFTPNVEVVAEVSEPKKRGRKNA